MEPITNETHIPESIQKSKGEIEDDRVIPPRADLKPLGDNIWIVDGPNVRDMGVLFSTRMEVMKLSDNSIWVNSPVPVTYEILNKITELGPVRYLVAATPRHAWRLEWDFDKLIIAHGPCIEKDAKLFVERAFRWLKH